MAGAEAAAAPHSADSERWKLWALQAAVSIGGLVPRSVAYGLARLAGDLAYRFREGAAGDVEDNMRHVMGPDASTVRVRKAAREVFRNVARYYVDLVRLPKMTRHEILDERARLHGFDRLKGLLAAGQAVVVATAHYGNPEIAVQVGTLLGLDVLVLAEPLHPPALARLMSKIRSVNGPRYVDVGYGAISQALRHLRAGGCLAIACDRDIQEKGAPIEFFGCVTRLPLGAVELAARTGALIMPACCRRQGDGFEIYFEEPLELIRTGDARQDALKNARALIARVEPWLAADPGQWMPLERIWKPLPAAEAPDGPSVPEAAATT